MFFYRFDHDVFHQQKWMVQKWTYPQYLLWKSCAATQPKRSSSRQKIFVSDKNIFSRLVMKWIKRYYLCTFSQSETSHLSETQGTTEQNSSETGRDRCSHLEVIRGHKRSLEVIRGQLEVLFRGRGRWKVMGPRNRTPLRQAKTGAHT